MTIVHLASSLESSTKHFAGLQNSLFWPIFTISENFAFASCFIPATTAFNLLSHNNCDSSYGHHMFWLSTDICARHNQGSRLASMAQPAGVLWPPWVKDLCVSIGMWQDLTSSCVWSNRPLHDTATAVHQQQHIQTNYHFHYTAVVFSGFVKFFFLQFSVIQPFWYLVICTICMSTNQVQAWV
jgi:hypothetical protein